MANMLAFLGRDMAVDLGTANTLVYVRGRGIALNEPSVVGLNTDTGKIVAVGVPGQTDDRPDAGQHRGDPAAARTASSADFDVTERMPRDFIQRSTAATTISKPRLVVAVPAGITGRGAAERGGEAGHQAGARRVDIIEEPMAAGSAPGYRCNEPTGNMVVDVGGAPEVATISLRPHRYLRVRPGRRRRNG